MPTNNEPKRKKLNGGRCNPSEMQGRKRRGRGPIVIRRRMLCAALRLWEIKNHFVPFDFNQYQPTHHE